MMLDLFLFVLNTQDKWRPAQGEKDECIVSGAMAKTGVSSGNDQPGNTVPRTPSGVRGRKVAEWRGSLRTLTKGEGNDKPQPQSAMKGESKGKNEHQRGESRGQPSG